MEAPIPALNPVAIPFMTLSTDAVRCEYVYMRLPTKDNPDPLRKPDNNKEVFADGEFGDFIKQIFDTLDLYHNSGVDPRRIQSFPSKYTEKNSSRIPI
ncbi:hypothetical protein [Scytonema sp. UIC 10036]|uniref:hypothetical protein n=1 Tax=Scytonema sp. UIC 10036 TaxID=2304196 RepID=UPI001A9B2B1C|nr:hypothetical protein [Scytonema sp. UIC 10036]